MLMGTNRHIVSPQRSSPIVACVQDAVSGSYILTNNFDDGIDIFVSWSTAMNCVSFVDSKNCISRWKSLLSRAYAVPEYKKYIIKNKNNDYVYNPEFQEMPGKLFYSFVFPENFSYKRETGTNPKFPIVEIEKGILLPNSGPLDKKVLGNHVNSIVHLLWLEYLPTIASKFITEVQNLTDIWFPSHGFSIGISDSIVPNREKIIETLAKTEQRVRAIEDKYKISDPKRCERETFSTLSAAISEASMLANKYLAKGDRNSFRIQSDSKTKGSPLNANQISGFCGQQAINGGRVPKHITNKTRTLPIFRPGEYTNGAGGFIYGCYLHGLTPAEVYDHGRPGRIAIAETALKTSSTGYFQRRMAEKTRSYIAEIDGSVRDHQGYITQFFNRGDGFNPKFLYPSKGGVLLPANPITLAKKMNAESNQQPEFIPPKLQEHFLSKIQSGYRYAKTPITNEATKILRGKYAKILPEVKVAPDKLANFFSQMLIMIERAKIEYGEAVGLIATNSIGEPTTQSTLNSPHSAGISSKKMTIGTLPRLGELLNVTKSEKLKIPLITVYFSDDYLAEKSIKIKEKERELANLSPDDEDYVNQKEQLAELMKNCINRMNKYAFLFEEIKIGKLVSSFDIYHIGGTINILDIHPVEEYKEEWWVGFKKRFLNIDCPEEGFVLVLNFNLDILYHYSVELETIAEKIREKFPCIASPLSVGKIEIYFLSDERFDPVFNEIPSEDKRSYLSNENAGYFIAKDIVVKYILDMKLSGYDGIVDVGVREVSDTKEWVLDLVLAKKNSKKMRDIFLKVLANDFVDPKKTTINDPWTVFITYGIEQARKLVIDEIIATVASDGAVSRCHVELLVDTMTRTGTLTSAGHHGIERRVGAITKATFERQVENTAKAGMYGETDNLKSIMAGVTMGKVCRVGTGLVDVIDHLATAPSPAERKEEDNHI